MNANLLNSKACNGQKRNAAMPEIIRPGRSFNSIKTSSVSGEESG
jgi:hypothetical protein